MLKMTVPSMPRPAIGIRYGDSGSNMTSREITAKMSMSVVTITSLLLSPTTLVLKRPRTRNSTATSSSTSIRMPSHAFHSMRVVERPSACSESSVLLGDRLPRGDDPIALGDGCHDRRHGARGLVAQRLGARAVEHLVGAQEGDAELVDRVARLGCQRQSSASDRSVFASLASDASVTSRE